MEGLCACFDSQGRETLSVDEVKDMDIMDGLVSTKLVAARLGVTRQAVRYMVTSGRLPAVQSPIGYFFDPIEVERMRRKREVG